ncbi:MAG TPA: cation diffusion facilitator family transporter [Symbiobacteriaceae bacterium]|jgi:cation diffusion facilitator family transporter
MNAKVYAARFSVGSNLFLVFAKLAIGLLSGSVSVLSEAIHSAIDLVAAIIALFSVRVASQPADEDHHYGHGKVENLSALVEGVLVLVAAGWIVYEALHKLLQPHAAPEVLLGMLVMAISSALNFFVSGYLLRVARKERSMALLADAVHLRTDVWTSLGVFFGLFLVKLTGFPWLDPVVAIAVAVMITKAGLDLCREALHPLVDAKLPEAEEQEIIGVIEQHTGGFAQFHNLRTRQSGSEQHVDFHLTFPGSRTLEEVHKVCDEIEAAVREKFPQAHVLIHPEPCPEDCDVPGCAPGQA